MWAIWVPALFSRPVGSDSFVVMGPMFGVSVLLGFIALAPAMLGAHRCLRDAKATELTSVRRTIEEARVAALDAGRESAESASRLPGLIAYERRIVEVSEWPFDARSLGRVALYVLIPLASWVGGALVERLVDAALG